MQTISLQEIMIKIIDEKPSKSKLGKKQAELNKQFDHELDKYIKLNSAYKKALRKNPKAELIEPIKPKEPIMKNNQKRIEGMREKFKKIVESFGINSNVFKVNNQYIFPIESERYVRIILLFDLNKTPLYNLDKSDDLELHFNKKQLEKIHAVRKTINKLIGYQKKNSEGLELAMKVTQKLKTNEKKAGQYIDELIHVLNPVANKVSYIFSEEKYPELTFEERVEVFQQIYLQIETFLEDVDYKINEAIHQTKDTTL